MGNYTVYMHITPNHKIYIGITGKKPIYRWNNGNGYKNNKHFFNAILKYGWENIEHIIIYDKLSKEDACKKEQELIKKYDTTNPLKGYNNSIGGESGSLGVKYSKEAIIKRLKNRKYESSWAKGKHFTEEHRRKIGEKSKGRKHSKETKEKISIANKGKSRKGHKWNDYIRKIKCKPIICIETKIQYIGLLEAERQTGISHSNICNCLKGKRQTAGGYHWDYVVQTI